MWKPVGYSDGLEEHVRSSVQTGSLIKDKIARLDMKLSYMATKQNKTKQNKTKPYNPCGYLFYETEII